MYKPTTRKQPKKYEPEMRPSSVEKVNFIKRNKQLHSDKKLADKRTYQPSLPILTSKHHQNMPPKPQQKSIPQKVDQLEKAVEKLSREAQQPDMQKMLLHEIQGIKSQLREIKQQIGLSPQQSKQPYQEYEQLEEDEENIANMGQAEEEQPRLIYPEPKNEVIYERSKSREVEEEFQSREGRLEYRIHSKKQLLDIGKIQPYMKEFKLQNCKIPQPIYSGYHKKSSKPIVIKYCSEGQSMEPQITLYERLWKNIVKAKKICINKVYQINEPMAHNLMALQMNKHHIGDIPLSPEIILKDTLRALQFLHECGFLFRDLHPSHVMQTFEGVVVLVGLTRMKRFTDIKGRVVEVRGGPSQQTLHQFVSNARLRGVPEGRKDDLQTLGYLALYLLEGRLPWSINSMVQGRSKVTLQNLYGRYGGLFQFMVRVHKMQTDEQPSYDQLYSLLSL